MAEKNGLQVGPDLVFPLDVVTQPIAIMGVRRSGKSNAAAVLAEEMFDHGLPWVAIDPKGDWWGLRSSADGTGPGLPVPIFGGLHGDMPLSPEAGALMAELIFEHNLTCVLDVSRFSIAARSRFLVAFGDRLFELHQADPQPRFIFLEEAHRILPQQVHQDMAHCVRTWVRIITEGGAFGLGIGILDQRCATVNKDGLTQIEALIPMRTTSPQDRKAIRDWMEHHAIAPELVESLPSLVSGEAWVSSSYWLPQHGLPALQRTMFRQRRTFDSGATPVVGQIRKATTLADIDLDALSGRMAAVVEQAEQNDPAKLRRRIAELERQARSAQPQRGRMPDEEWRLAEVGKLTARVTELQRQLAEAAEPERVEVPVLSPGDIAALEQSVAALQSVAGSIELALSRATRPAPAPARQAPSPRPVVPVQAVASGSRNNPGITEAGSATSLPKAQRAILTVLAQFPEGRTTTQLGMLTGYSSKGGGFRNALGALRTAGLIERGEPVIATAEGIAALGGAWEPLPSGAALLDHWTAQLPKAEGLILRALVGAYPDTMTKDEVAGATGYSPDGGGFRNALGKLRTLLLITGSADLRAEDTLAQEAREVPVA